MDTHETKDTLKPVQYFGEEARQFTADLLKGQGDQMEIQAVQTSRVQPYGTAILERRILGDSNFLAVLPVPLGNSQN